MAFSLALRMDTILAEQGILLKFADLVLDVKRIVNGVSRCLHILSN